MKTGPGVQETWGMPGGTKWRKNPRRQESFLRWVAPPEQGLCFFPHSASCTEFGIKVALNEHLLRE
jgi:hypothetical protein